MPTADLHNRWCDRKKANREVLKKSHWLIAYENIAQRTTLRILGVLP